MGGMKVVLLLVSMLMVVGCSEPDTGVDIVSIRYTTTEVDPRPIESLIFWPDKHTKVDIGPVSNRSTESGLGAHLSTSDGLVWTGSAWVSAASRGLQRLSGTILTLYENGDPVRREATVEITARKRAKVSKD